MAEVANLKLGFLTTAFGSHTGLIVKGGVSEVHYEEGNTPNLYETGTGFKSWVDKNKSGFYSGVTGTIMVPPTQSMPAAMTTDRKTMQKGWPTGTINP